MDLALIHSGKLLAEVKDIPVDGFTPLPEEFGKVMKADVYYYLRAAWRDSDGFLHFSKEQSMQNSRDYYSERKGYVGKYCDIFTDKTAFNPGETVKFKAVLYTGNQYVSFKVFEAGEDVEAIFVNAEDNEIAKVELKTNEFGSVAGEFKIPEGERNGRFTIKICRNNSTMESKSMTTVTVSIMDFSLPNLFPQLPRHNIKTAPQKAAEYVIIVFFITICVFNYSDSIFFSGKPRLTAGWLYPLPVAAGQGVAIVAVGRILFRLRHHLHNLAAAVHHQALMGSPSPLPQAVLGAAHAFVYQALHLLYLPFLHAFTPSSGFAYFS